MKARTYIRHFDSDNGKPFVQVEGGTMTEAALVEFATKLLMVAREMRADREARAKATKEHNAGVKRGDPQYV